MTDELNKLEQVFESEPEIKASDKAKNRAMKAAMQAFDENQQGQSQPLKQENHQFLQGNSSGSRLKDDDPIQENQNGGAFNPSFWRKLMKLSYLFPVAAAGTLAVSVLVLNPHLLTNNEKSDYLKLPQAPADNAENNARNNARNNKLKSEMTTASAPDKETVKVDQTKRKSASSSGLYKGLVSESDRLAGVSAPVVTPSPLKPQVERKKTQGAVVMRQSQSTSIAGNKARMINPVISSLTAEQGIADDVPVTMSPATQGRDKFASIKTNPVKITSEEPVSTFSIDVDTASYSFIRAALNRNTLPQKDAVRVEELINYFPYQYPAPQQASRPFKVNTTVMPSPWNAHNKLLHIGIKGYELPASEHPKSNLVFLLDTSGSMNQPNKLPLLINSFKLLLTTLKPDDTVAIVSYAGSAGTVLEPTQVKHKAKIMQALERLRAGGSTAGGQGIRLAYQLAESNYDKQAVNRVILATDGDFNVGIRSREELKSYIERKRKSGVFLSVLGFGMGNYNDALMQTLAQNGNGNAAYIDSLSEARKVLVDEASSTLFSIANDVKIQVEFNPKTVSQYRLIGYETRALKREDFNNDKVDAGDIGAGHTVTAIYEITPAGAENKLLDPLRYSDANTEKTASKKVSQNDSQNDPEYGYLKLRYKLPGEKKSQLIEIPIKIADQKNSLDEVSNDARFATAVAAFGQLLRDAKYTGDFSYDDVIKLALGAKGKDPFGYRAEFINLVRIAKTVEALH